MSESDDADEIRERRRQELQEQVDETSEPDPAPADTPDDPVHVETRDQFAESTAEGVVLADFYADWCGPCKQLEPIVERVAAGTEATVAKVDIDANQGLATQYGVRSVPTLLLFADGEPVERLVGVQQESRLRSLVDSYA